MRDDPAFYRPPRRPLELQLLGRRGELATRLLRDTPRPRTGRDRQQRSARLIQAEMASPSIIGSLWLPAGDGEVGPGDLVVAGGQARHCLRRLLMCPHHGGLPR